MAPQSASGASGDSPSAPINTGDVTVDGFFPLTRLKQQFDAYLSDKVEEIEEAKIARRYYHADQWSADDIAILRARGQPIVTYPRIGRKIDGIVGIAEQQRQDPKAYPRNPQDEQGADVATSCVRYVMERNEWTSKKPNCFRQALVDGIAGVELRLVQGDEGDPDIEIAHVMGDDYFYDPRSIRPNFTDARYHGLSKFMDVEEAIELFPDKDEELRGLIDEGQTFQTNSDRDNKWVNGGEKRLRLVEHWYKFQGKWRWAFYVGSALLAQGVSPFFDERGKTMSRFIMFSAAVDHEGDRYGMIRSLKGMQDEINQRRSKALHISNSRRLIMTLGAVDDVEVARREWARPDGIVVVNQAGEVKPDDTQPDLMAQFQFLEEAKNEMEAFANINPAALAGGQAKNLSGRAVNLLQKPGIAELGPMLIGYRNWTIRVYRAVWNMAQRYWTSKRWIRVTGDDRLAQFIKLNGLQLDEYGRPALVNAIGQLDVDIILDEGPDVQNMMQDAFDFLSQLPPGTVPVDILVKLMPIPGSVKEAWEAKLQQPPDPMAEEAKQVAMADAKAKVGELQASTKLKNAQAISAVASAAHKGSEAHLNAKAIFAGGVAATEPPQPAPAVQPQPAPQPLPSFAPPAGPQVPGASSPY